MTTISPQASGAASAGPKQVTDSPEEQSLEADLPMLRQRLLRHARFAVNEDGVAEDLVQDTLIAVIEQHEKRRGDASLLTWATAILKNKVADWYRSPDRRRMAPFQADDDKLGDAIDTLYHASGAYAEPIPAWQQPDNHLEQRQMMTVLERCVSCLPPKTGMVFMMREWLGFESAEICKRIGVSADNCRQILHRARMSLRDCMQRDWRGKEVNA